MFVMISSQLKKFASIVCTIVRSLLSPLNKKTKPLLLSNYYRPPAPDTDALDLLDDVLSRI